MKIQLKELAEQRNLNMSQVQRETGLTMGLVRRYWYNETESIQLDAIKKLCDYFNVDAGELLAIEQREN